MTGAHDIDAAGRAPPRPNRPNYHGAIYGSLLAGSVVVGAGAGGDYDLSPLRLAALLIATGLVFWLAHAYARLVGDQVYYSAPKWQQIRWVARHEWPLLQTTLPPVAAALLFGLLGASNLAAGWAALTVAIIEQVGWAAFTTARTGASRPLVLVTALIYLVLGVLIVMLKAALLH